MSIIIRTLFLLTNKMLFLFFVIEFVAAVPHCPLAATSCIKLYPKMYDCHHLTQKCLIIRKTNVSIILPENINKLTFSKESFLRLYIATVAQ